MIVNMIKRGTCSTGVLVSPSRMKCVTFVLFSINAIWESWDVLKHWEKQENSDKQKNNWGEIKMYKYHVHYVINKLYFKMISI